MPDGQKLRASLQTLGKKEIYIWKEMVLRDDDLFTSIYQLIYCDDLRIAWHAAWIIDHASEAEPGKLVAYVPEMIDHLPRLKSSSLKRHFTRMLNRYEIPEDKAGQLVDILYDLISPSEAIAVRANSLKLLCRIALLEPGLKQELKGTIQSILDQEDTPGIRSTGKAILRTLQFQ